jgi:hypothetical protein
MITQQVLKVRFCAIWQPWLSSRGLVTDHEEEDDEEKEEEEKEEAEARMFIFPFV